MAVPKRKTSKSRKGMRRANWKLDTPPMAICGHCSQPAMPHRVCPNCGYYKGRLIIDQTKSK